MSQSQKEYLVASGMLIKPVKGKNPALNQDGSTHDGPPSFSKKNTKMVERSWMECGRLAMSKLDSKIKKILENEGFYNDEIYFADYDSFEEIPLFSRWKSVSFLKDTPFDENNKLLISHAVKLAEHAMKVSFLNTKKEEYEDFFCCVTITKWDSMDEINCITPNIYITRKKKWLFSYVNSGKLLLKKKS